MPDIALTLNQLNILFQNLTMSMLGLDPTTWNSYQVALTAIKTVTISVTNPGAGYVPTDIITISGGTGGKFVVDTVDGTGKVLTGHISITGTGYSVANGVSTTGGTGTGLKLNITAINTWTDPIPSNPYAAVRISWQQEGAPAWKIDENITFLRCFEIDDQYNRQRDTDVADVVGDDTIVTEETSYTRVNSVSWIFYGPNSYENAQAIRDKMYYQEYKNTLALSNVYVVPDISAPTRAPELYASQWWDRVDLIMHFNELIVRTPTVTAIGSVPLNIETKDGTHFSQIIE